MQNELEDKLFILFEKYASSEHNEMNEEEFRYAIEELREEVIKYFDERILNTNKYATLEKRKVSQAKLICMKLEVLKILGLEPDGLVISKQCYEDYGQDLDGCSTQQSEGCGRCHLAKAKLNKLGKENV